MSHSTFRTAQLSDAEDLASLVNSAYRGEHSRNGWTTEADFLDGQRTDSESMSQLIGNENSEVLLLLQDSKIVGCTLLEKLEVKAILGMLTIEPKMQDSGLGKKLFYAAEKWIRENWKIDLIEIHVISIRESLISWYERLGFVSTGETLPFPYGQEQFGIPLREDLEFLVLRKKLS